MTATRNRKREQQGFTLIEIIAVLVILGILAVVAVPKYMNMQDQARMKAAAGLISSVQSQLSLGYANAKLTGAAFDATNECAKVVVSNSTGGDTAIANCSITGNIVTITGKVKDQTSTGYWNNPDGD